MLTLYRRHQKSCEHRAKGRQYRRCKCPLWVDGFLYAQRYDQAIEVCKDVAKENPTFAFAHNCLAYGYWGKRMYPQVIEEWKAYGQLSGDRNETEFAAAMEKGFRAAGWKGALSKGYRSSPSATQDRLLVCVRDCSTLCRVGRQRSGLPLARRCLPRTRSTSIGLED